MSSPPSSTLPVSSTAVDQTAQEWFVREVHPHDTQLKAWLRGSFPAVRDVDDVVQESYLRIWKNRAAQPIHSAKAFLFGIARHLALDLVRRQRSSPVDFTEDLGKLSVLGLEPDAAEALIARELLERLGDAIIALPAHYREVIILQKIHGLPQKEVAAKLGLSLKSVEKYVQRGLARMNDYLQTHGVHDLSR